MSFYSQSPNAVTTKLKDRKGDNVLCLITTPLRFDPIGNRVQSAVAVGSGQSETNIYSANALNQYCSINPLNPVNPVEEISPSYDYDGNLTTNGIWSYSWDAENRLTAVYSNNTLLISNTYDHQSRRIAKNVFEITQSGTNAIRQFSFVYDAWNLIQETIHNSPFSITNSYTWGLDLSGTLQGAGGVGGLLAVHRDGATFFPCFDANGNVTEYMDASGAIKAHYAFDAFGNTISQNGDMASTFSHRFSTKYADDETGLYYYGYRYYAPELGRWVNRDPIGEDGGYNLYASVDNAIIMFVDVLGYVKAKPVPRQPPLKKRSPNNPPTTPLVTPPVTPPVPVQFLNSCCPVDKIKAEIVKKSQEALNDMMKNPLIIYWEKTYLRTGRTIKIPQNYFREYGGYICCDKNTKKITSTGPYPGTWKDENDNLTEKPWVGSTKGTTANFVYDEKSKCAKGTDAVAFYHTHPPGSTVFSGNPGDFGFATQNNIVITLLAPGMDKILVGMVGIGTGEIPLPPEK